MKWISHQWLPTTLDPSPSVCHYHHPITPHPEKNRCCQRSSKLDINLSKLTSPFGEVVARPFPPTVQGEPGCRTMRARVRVRCDVLSSLMYLLINRVRFNLPISHTALMQVAPPLCMTLKVSGKEKLIRERACGRKEGWKSEREREKKKHDKRQFLFARQRGFAKSGRVPHRSCEPSSARMVAGMWLDTQFPICALVSWQL